MHPPLNEAQQKRRGEFAAFVATHVEPLADSWEREQVLPDHVIAQIGRCGYLGATISRDYGGQSWDVVTFGLLNEAFGKSSASLTSVLTVQSMVAMAIQKWGTREQKSRWLPLLASGELIAAFAMTEPQAGSALQTLTTTYARRPGTDGLILNGRKRWITWGQRAGLFLVFGKLEQQPVACLVPRSTPGLTIEPIRELMGFRAAGLASVTFSDVEVPSVSILGRPGFAQTHIAPIGLQYGRISTACSALGMLEGCFDDSVEYASTRRIGDRAVGDIGMIRTLITRMGVDLQAARHLCHSACCAADEGDLEAFEQAFIAKYFTSQAAVRAASDAVQIKGAAGCHESSRSSRYYRCAKITEIIEGTTQVHEDLLGEIFVSRATRPPVKAAETS